MEGSVKMCEYCEKEKRIEENENDNIYFEIYGRFLRVMGKAISIPIGRQVKINYCPMCRKKISYRFITSNSSSRNRSRNTSICRSKSTNNRRF